MREKHYGRWIASGLLVMTLLGSQPLALAAFDQSGADGWMESRLVYESNAESRRTGGCRGTK